ncbi:MAG: hybrid sensor histidine kinase/response regulator [Oscillatoria sp. SIO1A7]|nr:hybrid sensor histidine kinase/response regulator [Oscillatoria sp. SIO1A7]
MKKILVIEDEEQVRENLVDLLDAEDYEAIGAENGRVGVSRATGELPDLILCDVMMPELDGYGVIDELRQNPDTATIPFIFLTAKAEKADRAKGMELGADNYLAKPFTREELLAAIAARLGKQAAIEEKSQKKLEELRRNIARAMPHELRTPLNGILSYSQMLLEECEELDPSEIREMAEDIHSSGQRLYRLTQNYLLYAELELAKYDPSRRRALQAEAPSLAESAIAESAREIVKLAKREADLQLQVREATVNISPTHLYKIVAELVDNACKYSSPGLPCLVGGSTGEDGDFILSVSDRGRGMTREQIDALGAYMQFDRENYEQQGSGLGLAIAKSLAELYNGQFSIESVPGEGTTVRVTLPLASEPTQSDLNGS